MKSAKIATATKPLPDFSRPQTLAAQGFFRSALRPFSPNRYQTATQKVCKALRSKGKYFF